MMLVQAYPVQHKAMTLEEYLALPEDVFGRRRDELEFGWLVREPAPHFVWHEFDVDRLKRLLQDHVWGLSLGIVGTGEVVLDKEKALTAVPDISVVLGDRVQFAEAQIWGPPNIAIEVASPSTQRRDRQKKLVWYREYGVEECWLVYPRKGLIEVHRFKLPPDQAGRVFRGDEIVESDVLPDFRFPVAKLLATEERERLARFRYDKPRS